MTEARTKPTLAMLKATKRATAKDYRKMVAAASEVVMRNRVSTRKHQGESGNPEYVLITFPYFIKFQKGFPKGHLAEKKGLSNTYKVNAVKLLNWLHSNGYCKYDARTLVARTQHFEQFDASIDRMFRILDK